MLPDQINVNFLNKDSVQENYVYSRYRNRDGGSIFHEATHSDTNIEQMSFSAIDPKPSGTFLGQRKASIKGTSTATVKDSNGVDIQRNNIVELKTSFAVGTSEAEKWNLVTAVITTILNADVYNKLLDKGHY